MSQKFTDFLSDENVFRAAADHWHRLFTGLPCHPADNGWVIWGKLSYRFRLEDGANIYSAVSETKRRGVSIVQCAPNCPNQLVAWMAKYGEGFDEHPIDYIKISLIHTDETEDIALRLLERFVCGGASLKEMDELITQLGVG